METNQQESIAVKKSRELTLQKAQQTMSPAEYAQHQKIIERMDRAKQLRNQSHKYFDGMTFEQTYATNEDLKNTYLTPKLNSTEVRVNTGTSEKKLDAIKNELLTMNLVHDVRAFDQEDLEIQELGDDMGDIVTRTNQQEKDEDLWEEIIDELLSQPIVYIRETFQTQTLRNNTQTIAMAKKELVPALKVFPASWTTPAHLWDTQPYVIIYDRLQYEQAEALLAKTYPNFKHVRPNKRQREEYLGGVYNYQFGELQDGEVELITYESLPDNEYQIYANGVPLLAPGSPLPYNYNHYDIRAYTVKTMSRNFLAGRPFTMMAKTMQAVANETIRLLIRKFQQALEPPMATPKGKIYAKGIWDPGAITQGLRKSDFEKLIDHNGVTEGEFAMYKLIEQKTEEFIGTPNIAQGMQGSREMSATEVLTVQKQFIKQLGYTVAALSRMKRDLTELRIYNIMENYLDPIKRKMDPMTKEVQEIYRSFTLENSNFSNNRKGRKIIKLSDKSLTPPEEESLKDFEDEQEKLGKPIRIKFVNRNVLKSFSISWYVNVSMQDKEGTSLDKVIFQDQLTQAAMITKVTGKPMNPDVVTETFERKWKAKDWFNVEVPEGEQMMNDANNPSQSQPGQVQQDSQKLLDEIKNSGIEAPSPEGTMGAQVSRGLRDNQPESGGRPPMAMEASQ